MEAALGIILLICFIGGFHPQSKIPEGEMNLAIGTDAMVRIRPNIKPLSDSAFKNIVKQQHDYSCGSAALGTLMNHCLGEQLSEKQIINGLMKYGDVEQIKRLRAFSLWDMQQFVEALGYRAGGFRAELADLKEPENWPCIIPIELFGYRHFVVLKGIHKDHVFVADPWRGNGSYPLNTFEKMWYKSILFKVFPDRECAVPRLALTEKDMRFIDQDMEKSLVLDPTRFSGLNEVNQNQLDSFSGQYKRFKN